MANAMRSAGEVVNSRVVNSLERVDEDLEIMERYDAAMEQVEDQVKDAMRKWDREHKDSCLHSVPRPRKHMR